MGVPWRTPEASGRQWRSRKERGRRRQQESGKAVGIALRSCAASTQKRAQTGRALPDASSQPTRPKGSHISMQQVRVRVR
eukprot:1240746-Pleurochrysis_carterae.AAC.1